MTEDEITKEKEKIDKMSQSEMAKFWRFAPSGHPYFNRTLPLYEHFRKRFKGFTPQLSKEVGLDP